MKKPTSILEQHLAKHRILARQEALSWALKKLGASREHPVSMHAIERALGCAHGSLSGYRCPHWRELVKEARKAGLITTRGRKVQK